MSMWQLKHDDRSKPKHGPTVEYGKAHDGRSSADDLKRANEALEKVKRERPLKPPGRK